MSFTVDFQLVVIVFLAVTLIFGIVTCGTGWNWYPIADTNRMNAFRAFAIIGIFTCLGALVLQILTKFVDAIRSKSFIPIVILALTIVTALSFLICACIAGSSGSYNWNHFVEMSVVACVSAIYSLFLFLMQWLFSAHTIVG